MTLEQDFGALQAAYMNAQNELRITKELLRKAEQELARTAQALASMAGYLNNVANHVTTALVDQKGTGGSGGEYKPRF